MLRHAILSVPFARRFLLLVWVSITGETHAAPPPAFVAGDRWVAIGYSITQDTPHKRYVELFQVIRRPDQPITYGNAGFSGDSANGGLRRLEWDILPAKGPIPTVAAIMPGMIDCGRELYAVNSPDEKTGQLKRRNRLDAYAKAMRTCSCPVYSLSDAATNA